MLYWEKNAARHRKPIRVEVRAGHGIMGDLQGGLHRQQNGRGFMQG